MPNPTTFKPFVTTLKLSLGEWEGSIAYTFAPQTTSFTPPRGRCGSLPQAIRCQAKPENITSGVICLADMVVDSTTTTLPTECFPETYDNIWRPISNSFSNQPGLAYPGTACISGWTSACNTTVHLKSGQEVSQTWCCPPGGWTCLTVDPGETPYRDCVSMLSTPTEVWVNNLVTKGSSETTLWSSWRKVSLSDLPSSGPIKLKHPPFPLYGIIPPGDEDNSQSGLTTGAIAGMAIGIVVTVLILIGIAVFVCLRKRKEKRLAQSQVTAVEGDPHYKGLGYDTKQELPGHGSESRELQPISPPPVELSSQTKPSEVEGQPPVELAS